MSSTFEVKQWQNGCKLLILWLDGRFLSVLHALVPVQGCCVGGVGYWRAQEAVQVAAGVIRVDCWWLAQILSLALPDLTLLILSL